MTEPSADAPPSTFLQSLGVRGRRRAEPRTSIAIAGAGCALAVLGVLIVAGDTGSGGDEFNRWPGVVLSALVVAAGLYTLAAVRVGPLATAGTVAAALGVPPLVFFLSFDDSGFPPYSSDAILIVSALAWLAAYLVGPGRGRPFFLGAGLLTAWLAVLQVAEDVFDLPFNLIGGFAPVVDPTFEQSFEGDVGGGFQPDPFVPVDAPDPATMGFISLAFGVGYLYMTRRLDRRGHHGAATPFALATLPTLYFGTVLLSDELEQAGTGLLLMLVGAGLAYHGATLGRRATAWSGGAATAIGAAVFLSDMTDDPTVGGMLFLAAGIALVAAGHAVAGALGEPDEMQVSIGDRAVAASVGAPSGVATGGTATVGAGDPSPGGDPAATAEEAAAADDPWAPPPPPAPPAASPPPAGPPDDEWAPPEDGDDLRP